MLVDSYRYRTSDHKPVFVRRCNWDVLPENVGSIPTVTAFLLWRGIVINNGLNSLMRSDVSPPIYYGDMINNFDRK